MAGADYPGDGRGLRHGGDHAPGCVSKPCVWRWQRRFMEAGVDALLHDKTRKPGKAPVPEPIVAQLVERTLGAPPGETAH